jgi:hypothetical protein
MRAAILAAIAFAFSVSQASAVSLAVKLACADDYFAHCSMYAPESPGVRTCMRAVGRNLSPRCIGALRDAGEIKQTRVASAKKHIAQKPTATKHYASKPSRKTYASKHDTRKKYAQRKATPKEYAHKRHSYTKLARN